MHLYSGHSTKHGPARQCCYANIRDVNIEG